VWDLHDFYLTSVKNTIAHTTADLLPISIDKLCQALSSTCITAPLPPPKDIPPTMPMPTFPHNYTNSIHLFPLPLLPASWGNSKTSMRPSVAWHMALSILSTNMPLATRSPKWRPTCKSKSVIRKLRVYRCDLPSLKEALMPMRSQRASAPMTARSLTSSCSDTASLYPPSGSSKVWTPEWSCWQDMKKGSSSMLWNYMPPQITPSMPWQNPSPSGSSNYYTALVQPSSLLPKQLRSSVTGS
jgi:hypothetical protein